jgi:hypothetical protein
MAITFGKAALVCLSILLGTSGLVATAQPTLLSFACNGTMKDGLNGEKGDPVQNIGAVVNLADKTVSFAGFTAPFNKVDAANIYFHGTSRNQLGMDETVDGNLDRVTGSVEASVTSTLGGGSKSYSSTSFWSMVCKPATRLF